MKKSIALSTCCAAALLGSACSREERRDIHSARPETRPEIHSARPEAPPEEHQLPRDNGAEGTTGAPVTAEAEAAAQPMAATAARKARGKFEAAPGVTLDGEADLEEVSNGVRVRVSIEHAPNGMKAIHIYEKGDCRGLRNDSMGQHFNPGATAHGLPDSREHHAGDLGNILVAKDGTGKLEIVATNVNLREDDPTSILNRALVIHEGEDVGAQPSGGAGRPIACAVLRKE